MISKQTGKGSQWVAFADRIAGMADPSLGDEREREITMRAYTVAQTMGAYIFMAFGVVLAALGHWWIAFAVIILSGLQTLIAQAYAKQHGIDLVAQTDRVSPQRKRLTTIVVIVVLVALLGARIYQLQSGHALFGNDGATDTDAAPWESIGLVCGALAAGVVATVSAKMRQRREAAKQHDPASIDDED